MAAAGSGRKPKRMTCKCTNVPKKGGGRGTRIIKKTIKKPTIKRTPGVKAKTAPAKKPAAKKAAPKKPPAKSKAKGQGAKCKCTSQ